MDLPAIRKPSAEEIAAGKVCQECTLWVRDAASYGRGVCAIGGLDLLRWTDEIDTCDGWKPSLTKS